MSGLPPALSFPPERENLRPREAGQTLAHVPYGHRASVMIMGKATSCTGLCSDPKDGSRRKLTYAAPGRLARVPADGTSTMETVMAFTPLCFFVVVPFSGRGAALGLTLVRFSLSPQSAPPHPRDLARLGLYMIGIRLPDYASLYYCITFG